LSRPSRIVVVDPARERAAAVAARLVEAGYVVECGYSGAEALELVLGRGPALVLLAPGLPELDGLGLCRQLKTEAPLVVVVAMVSGADVEGDEALDALQAAADGLLLRPVEPRALLAQVAVFARLLELQHVQREQAAMLDRARRDVDQAQARAAQAVDEAVAAGSRADAERRARAQVEELLERTGELAHVGGWEVYIPTKKLTWTKETFRIAELDGPDVPALEEGINLYAPEARPVIAAAVQAAMDSGTPYDLELPIITAKGRHRWVQTQGFAELEDGAPIRLFGTFQDITARKQAALALATSEARFRDVVEASPVPMALNDAQGNVIYVNRAFIRTFGYEREDIPTLSEWWPKAYPDAPYREWVADAWDARRVEASRFGTPFQPLELTIRCKDGSDREVIVSAAALAERYDGQHLVLLVDITERRHAERALQASSDRLESILEHAGGAIMAVSETGTVRSFNSAAERLLGYTADEVIGRKSPTDFHEPAQLAARADVLAAELGEPVAVGFDVLAAKARRGLVDVSEWTYVRKDGSRAPVSVSVTAYDVADVRDGRGRTTEFIALVHDLTDRKAVERELREARTAAEAANRAKDEFLANMSHELRTPLTAILGFSDVLRSEGNIARAPEQRLQAIDTIQNASTHLLTIINDILDLSKLEAGRMTVERIRTPLTEIASEVVRLIEPGARAKGLRLDVRLKSSIPRWIDGDPTRLRQILLNLLGNAVKFTETGSVALELRVDSLRGADQLYIDVHDTGMGMDAEERTRLFEVFAQADGTVSRRFGGTGLGLAISRRLARVMGGDVILQHSAPSRGSCFRLVLPFSGPPSAEWVSSLSNEHVIAPTESLSRVVALKGRILLAEDSPDNQLLIAFHLRKAGASVQLADDGAIALRMIDQSLTDASPFDLLVTDVQMPEMDGLTLVRTLRERGNTIPIIALTAHAMGGDREKCMEAGCNDYATKPVNKARLLAACERWLRVLPD
jgi:PAS domain S-box-containing protein